MVSHKLLRDKGVLIIEPGGPLEASDFQKLGQEVDEYIVAEGALTGVMLCAEEFPGWENLDALMAHMNFVKNNHADIGKVAAVSDSNILKVIPRILDLFVSAEVRNFESEQRDEAMKWLTEELAGTGDD